MDVYCVRIVGLSTGTRIEAFRIKTVVFENKQQAIDYAKNFIETFIDVGDSTFNTSKYTCLSCYEDDSEYFYTSGPPSSGYDEWPKLEVAVTKEKLDLKNGFEIEFQA